MSLCSQEYAVIFIKKETLKHNVTGNNNNCSLWTMSSHGATRERGAGRRYYLSAAWPAACDYYCYGDYDYYYDYCHYRY